MATTQVDDHDAAVVYSQPSMGYHWSTIASNISYDNTLALTRVPDATATLTFNGTSIKVYGQISPSGTGATPSSSYTIDGGTPQFYNAEMTSSLQSQVQFFASPQVSSGQHKLVVTNLIGGADFWLDFFVIPSGSTIAATQNTPASTSSPDGGSQPSTAVQTRLITSEVVVGSSTFTTVSTQTIGSDSSPSGSSTARSKTPLGPIVGGVIGGIAVLTLITALIIFFRQRDRKIQEDEFHPWPRGPSVITPFTPPPAVPPPNMSQSSGTSSPSGRFGEQFLESGHAGAAFPAHLPPAQVTGKRQVTAPDDPPAASAAQLDANLREEERIGGNEFPSTSTMNTSHQRVNVESHQGVSNGISVHTDVNQTHPMYDLEESPPAYQTGAPGDAERILGGMENTRNLKQ